MMINTKREYLTRASGDTHRMMMGSTRGIELIRMLLMRKGRYIL
jgi:hypothetical protein